MKRIIGRAAVGQKAFFTVNSFPGRRFTGVVESISTKAVTVSNFQLYKKMSEIISERGMTMEQFHQKMLEEQKKALAKAVSEGKLTQEQADKMIQRMEQRHNNPSPRKGN